MEVTYPWHVILVNLKHQRNTVDAVSKLECVQEVWAPTRTVVTTIRAKRVTQERYWFGRCVMARWDGEDPYAWHHITDINGVSAILGGASPQTVPDHDVERASAWISELNGKLPSTFIMPPCAVGDIIEFSYLMFFKHQGRCVNIEDETVCVKITLLGRETPVYIPFNAVLGIVTPAEGHTSPRHIGKRRRYRKRRGDKAAAADRTPM